MLSSPASAPTTPRGFVGGVDGAAVAVAALGFLLLLGDEDEDEDEDAGARRLEKKVSRRRLDRLLCFWGVVDSDCESGL